MALSAAWKNTVDNGLTNPAWDVYDALITSEVDAYNLRLKTTPGFLKLDWQNFKAMAWVETGALSPAWTIRPMQIGNPGDSGLSVLQNGAQGSLLIMSKQLQKDVSTPGKTDDPSVNIQAGIAYMLVCLIRSNIQSVISTSDPSIYTYQIVSHDNFSVVAKKVGTTVENLQSLNPTHRPLHIKQVIKYQKASMERVITGWSSDFIGTAATVYNTGDPDYADKMKYVLALFPRLVRPKKK